MKTAIIVSIISIGGVISSFTWVPGAFGEIREWMNAPTLKAQEEQYNALRVIMSGMKHYDIRTDELAADVREIISTIRELEREKGETPNISPAHKRSLERQIESYKKKLLKKGDMLHRATAIDQRILAELSGQAS